MTDLSPAATLTAAADKLRAPRYPKAATMTGTTAALLSAREPLADWLDAAARDAAEIGASPHALAVARRILEEQP